jgi:hypothetical protein
MCRSAHRVTASVLIGAPGSIPLAIPFVMSIARRTAGVHRAERPDVWTRASALGRDRSTGLVLSAWPGIGVVVPPGCRAMIES